VAASFYVSGGPSCLCLSSLKLGTSFRVPRHFHQLRPCVSHITPKDAIMHKLTAAIVFAFLLGITLTACADKSLMDTLARIDAGKPAAFPSTSDKGE
jgi:hypothetical protein